MDTQSRMTLLARAAADEVRPGMIVGLGTGSTAAAVLRELGARVANGLDIRGVATSRKAEMIAREVGIPLVEFDDVQQVDLGIDGADELDESLDAIKGGGGALLHEKLVAASCTDYLIVAASEKLSPALGTRFRLPVEVLPFGWTHTAGRLRALGVEPVLRPANDGEPFLTDAGHLILDCTTGPIAHPAALASRLKSTTGVVDHGLFVGIARRAMISEVDGTVTTLTR